ncbi:MULTISPECIES: relaxosome component [Gammaproteobacteria]|uniref:Relaxosome component n=2 Tax=Gammaproteobacteria TaxID=1236 RepID=K8W9F4_9GAMM|nr:MULTISPECIES: relaxosome component [Gammaproteobacteria]EKT52835.1 relaxosome component [Providencia sneebia DSM 19967]
MANLSNLKILIEDKKTYKDRYQRKNFISLCLSDEELTEVELLAEKLDLKRAAAIRALLLNKSAILKNKIKNNGNKEYLFLLNNISNNINQIAKKINANIDFFINSANGEQFAYLFEELTEDIEKIKEVYNDTQTDRR